MKETASGSSAAPAAAQTDSSLAGAASFDAHLRATGLSPLLASKVTTLQVNVGKRCNQACHHCHVDAGPLRTEIMQATTASRVIELMTGSPSLRCVDITGGAPELNPSFRSLVDAATRQGHEVIDRCNLTILLEEGMEDLADFLADRRVHIIASLPCYGPENVDKQRGNGVFDKSITALLRLNELGYGQDDSGLQIDLVYNPAGAFLPPDQGSLEASYKDVLDREFGVRFNQLLTLTNLPIARFAHALQRDGQLEAYMSLLVNHFNPATVDALMCRSLVSVGWDGALYDCDFNQMLDIAIARHATDERLHLDAIEPQATPTIWDITSLSDLDNRPVVTGSHCFGCTAGAGSSCGGALADN